MLVPQLSYGMLILGNSEASMVGSYLHREILCPMPNSRECKEEREEYLLFGLLYKYLPSLCDGSSFPQISSNSTLCLS